MIIKKFVGKTEEEAVAAAKKELGEGVVIMNVKTIKRKGIFALFCSRLTEVTVALEDEKTRYPVREIKPAQAPAAKANETHVAAEKAAGLHLQASSAENIEKKLDSLQTLLESQIMKSSESTPAVAAAPQEPVAQAVATPEVSQAVAEEGSARQEDSEQDKFVRLLYNTMIDNEVDEKYANQILEEIEKTRKPNMPMDYILANIYQKMILKFGKAEGITPASQGAKIVLFLGPTGVGKTTTIAKIASIFSVEEKKKVALLTSDTYRIAAAEQLRTYANILEVPFRVIYTKEELHEAIADFADYDYIFIDTAGHSHHNEKQLQVKGEMFADLSDVKECQAFLVLSATTKYSDLIKIAECYKKIMNYQLIFTKLDETDCVGNLLNLKLHTETSIAYIACGQNVPDDIEVFNPQKTVKQLLGGKK